MKIATKALLASALALTAAAPALAVDTAMDHRMHATGKRAPHAVGDGIRDNARMSHATDSMASEPGESFEGYGYRYFRDCGIGSQS
jgi:Spy/CpxP family protein refolding chaperone